jgi:membrane-associated protein
MSVSLTNLLEFLQAYGYPILWLYAFVAAFGAPLPVTLLLLAAGAFSAQGDFNVVLLVAIATSASVAGDCAGYLVGRLWGSRVLDWLPRSRFGRRFIDQQAIERSRLYFQRRGGWAIFLTRFLITALGSVTNLVAGTELFPFRSFLLCDFPGEALGSVIPLALGFTFSASWEAVGDILGAISLFALGLVCIIVLTQRLMRYLKRVKRIRRQEELQLSKAQVSGQKEQEG